MGYHLPEVLRARAEESPRQQAYTFLGNGEVEAERLLTGELDRRARAIAARLQALGAEGEPTLLLYPPGLDFIAAFFGCLYAKSIAIPSYPPRQNQRQHRIRAIVQDACPRVALTNSKVLSKTQALSDRVTELEALRWVDTDELDDEWAEDWKEPTIEAGTPAFLQYTSGSTASPKGVIVSHGNLIHNQRLIQSACLHSASSVFVSWLPLYHDLGLIGNLIQSLYVGGRCVLMSPSAFLQKPLRWLQAVSSYRATTSGGPNFAYELCLAKVSEEERAELDLASWEVAFNGAEPVRQATLERFSAAFAPCRFRRQAFYPCYGLAEATLIVSGGEVHEVPVALGFEGSALERNFALASASPTARVLVSSGRVLGDDQHVAIVSPETSRICGAGEIGEIWLSGPSVALGYWKRPEETRETFQAVLADTGEGPFLRTGDLGFYQDGQLFVTGRLKDLVIIRGRNHYPQDIELTAEQSHPALRRGGGAAFALDLDGQERLVVVHEIERRRPTDLAAVASAVRLAIAEAHEVEVHELVLVRADAVPKTSSGKVQRRACRALYLAGELPVLGRSLATSLELPAEGGDALSREAILAALPKERRGLLEEYLRRQLGIRRGSAAPGTSLAALGLDSLRILELQQRLETELGCSLPLSELFAAPDLAALADDILEQWESPAPRPVIPLEVQGETAGDHPMSHGQEALWFVDRLAPESAAYNLAAAARWRGVTPDQLVRGLRELVIRHPALRTTIAVHDGVPVQRVHDRLEPEFVIVDASDWGEARLQSRMTMEAYRPFDLTCGPLLRVAVFIVAPGEQAVVLAAHHVVADLWSFAVLLHELGTICASVSGGMAALPPLRLRYTDAVRWHRRRLAGEEGDRLSAFWQQRLAGELPVLDLPTDRPRPRVQTYGGAARLTAWDEGLTSTLRALGRSQGATFYMTLLSGFFALLHRVTGQTDLLVGSPAAGRESADLAGLVGYFVNPVVVRATLAGEIGFADLLAQLRRSAAEAFEHQGFPLALLVERLHAARDPGRSPLFQVLFTLQGAPFPGAEGIPAFALGKGGVRLAAGAFVLETLPLVERRALFDLTLTVAELEGCLALSLQFNSDLFDPVTAERLLAHLRALLAAAATDPARAVADLSLLSAAERHQALHEWNATEAVVLEPAGVHRRFSEQATRTPEAVAVEHAGETWTYCELNERANRLARYLQGLGVGPETRVGICLERSPRMVAGLLGVLKAGGAYVPLDPTYPRERLDLMLRDAGVRLVLTESGTSDLLAASGIPVVDLDAAASDFLSENAGEPAGSVFPDGLVYVLYTSGSTGRPKGVEIQHRSLVSLVDHLRRALGTGPSDILLSVTTLSFDIAAVELFLPLTSGGRLVLVERESAADGIRLVGEIERSRATLMQATPSTWQLLLEAAWQGSETLTAVSTGEAFPPELARWLAPRTARRWNLYGPTETTIYSSFHPVGEREGAVPIGRPVANTQIHLLDCRLEPVSAGVVGDLYIGGLGLARGYHGRPDLTAAAFLPDPWAGEPGARFYRSGDLGRHLPSGEIDFLGRVDAQVKVRGHRIELGEIETTLSRHPAVAQAVAAVREDRPGDRRLTAYAVLQAGGAAEATELRTYLKEFLPEHSVPSMVVVLPSLPLTPSGKIDRRALPVPEVEGPVKVLPRGPVEEVLAGIWCDVLGVQQVGADDNFFELGGHSLLAARILARLREAFRIELPLSSLFAAPTLAGLAARLMAARGRTSAPPLRAIARGTELPLSPAQARLWFLYQLAPGSAAYNISLEIELSGPLAERALAAACVALVQRHEALRTTVRSAAGGPIQVVSTKVSAPLRWVDLGALPVLLRAPAANRLAHEEACRTFDLEMGPPVRFALFRTDRERHQLLLTVHHIVADGGSARLLIEELAVLYEAFAVGEPAALPSSVAPLQLGDFVIWRQRWMEEGGMEAGFDYWRRQLANAPVALELPEDRPRPPVQSFAGALRYVPLPAPLVASLEARWRNRGATRFMVLLAGFQALLQRYTGQESVVIGSPFADSGHTGLERAVGLFIDTVALHTSLVGDPSFADLVARGRETCLGAHEHRHVPFDRLIEDLPGGRDLSRNPLFQVLFALDRAPAEATAAGVVFRPHLRGTASAKVDLSLYLVETEAGFEGAFEYATALFEETTIARMAGHLGTLLVTVATEPERRVADLPLLAAGERAQLLAEWNDTGMPGMTDGPGEICLHDLFDRQAARTPEAQAVVFEGQGWSYAELSREANRLARLLIRLGVGPESVVGICVQRSWELIVGLLGILKAGGAYLPLDPGYPPERLAFMLHDAGAVILLTEERLAGLLPASAARVVLLDAGGLEGEPLPDLPPSGRVLPDNPAYVIYTSGSTGRPKGVVIAHRGICNRLLWMQETYQLTSADRVLQKTPIGFDVSVWELFWPLITGSCLVLARPGGHQDSTYLARLIAAAGITTLHFVPSMLGAFLTEDDLSGCGTLRRVICSGEALSVELVERFFSRLDAELHNLYGPTEASVDVTASRCSPGSGLPRISIGRPIAGMRTLVLDKRLQLSPLGVPAQLYLGGVGLARGYIGRPDLTAERFVPDPYAEIPGERLYQTGDLARYRPDGGLDFLGRIDHQTKIRGFRIELGEVEAVLAGYPAVREAVVTATADEQGELRLVAYLVTPEAAPIPLGELRAFLGRQLPEFMIPAHFVFLDGFPLSANGKLDHRALPAPGPERPELRERFVAPRGPVEEGLAAIWSQVLGIDRVGIHDNFFELGGDSIRSIQVRSRARVLGLELSLQQLFAHRTIAELAREVRHSDRSAVSDLFEVAWTEPFPLLTAAERRRLPEDVEDAFPLSRLQEGLIFHSEYSVDYEVYITSFRLRGRFDAAALRGALRRLVRRHPMLRTSFDLTGFTEPIQRVHSEATVPLIVEDLRSLPAAALEARINAWERAERQAKFSWDRAPFARIHVHRTGNDVFRLALVHSILDGWSMALMATELFRDYAARLRGEDPALPPPPAVSYRDFVALERGTRQSMEAQAFWKDRLQGAQRVQLPRWNDDSRPEREFHARRPLEVSAVIVHGLQRLVRSLAVPLKSALLAAHLRVIGLLAGQTDVVAGLLANGRPEEPDGDQVLGLFLNAVPLRLDLSGGTWEELVQSAFAAEWELLPYRRFPLAELHREYGGAVFETVFNFTHFHVFAGLVGLDGLEVLGASAPSDQTYFPLTLYLNLDPVSTRLHLAVDYDTRELCAEQVERIIGYHLAAFAAMAEQPQARHDAVCLLAPEERQQLESWNRSLPELPEPPEGMLVHHLIENQIARTPCSPALIQGERTWTYEELGSRAERIARRLRRLGVGPEIRVGVCLRRTIDLPVAVLAVLKAGGAYVPLDPAYPRERLAFMVEDSEARVLLTEGDLAAGLARDSVVVLRLDEAAAADGGEGECQVPGRPGTPANPAYVIYTSGSTGRPKGVVVPHRGVVNFLLSMQRRPGLGPQDRLLAVTSLSFDIAVLELLLPLTVGARVWLASSEVTTNGERLVELLNREPPTVMQATPATWRLILEAGWEGTPGLRALCGGEALPRDLAAALLCRTESLWNLYGPTETTVWSTVHRVEEGAPLVSLGRPVANTGVYVLDAGMLPAPVGTAGEVYLGGAGVVRCYAGRPDLTAERFVPDPFAAEPGARVYRTGDLARHLPDGELEFLGRIDHQVKIRGFRIELGEIEAILAEHEGVREAGVVARSDASGDVRLVACVVAELGAEAPTAANLRALLRRRLPEHMLPAAFVPLPALPLTANRKLDRRALAVLAEGPATEGRTRTTVPPRDALELQLARLWEEVLGIPKVGVTEDFFELGGHSLLALRLMAHVRKRFQRHLPLSVLFRGATVERLAALLRQGPGEGPGWPGLVEIQPLGARTPFFCVHPVGGSVLCYAELARQMGPEQPFFGLQAPELVGGQSLARIEDRARYFVQVVRDRQPAGPYCLGGWSMGAVIAFEMAQQLTRAGEMVDLVALLDAACPAGASANATEEIADAALAEWFERDLAGSSGIDFGDFVGSRETGSSVGDLLERVRASAHPAADLDLADARGLYELFKRNLAALYGYVPQPYSGRLLLVRASERPLADGDANLGWGAVAAGTLDVQELEGNHYSLLQRPQVGTLAAILKVSLGGVPMPRETAQPCWPQEMENDESRASTER